MKIRIGETQIQISIFIIFIPVALWFVGCLKEYAAAFFSIAIHELAHFYTAWMYGCKPGIVRIMPVGLSVSLNVGNCSRAASVKIYSAGPAANLLILLAAALSASVFPNADVFWRLVISTNAYLALFNLIPAFPLDGGRILLELLAGRMGIRAAGRLTRRMALVLALIIILIGALQLYASIYNFSLIIIGVYIIALWKNSKMESALMNVKQIIYRRSRLLKRGIYPARDLVVLKSTRLDETLKNMDFDSFHLVHVLGENLRLLRVFTENEIMDAISTSDVLTFGELLEGSFNSPGQGGKE